MSMDKHNCMEDIGDAMLTQVSNLFLFAINNANNNDNNINNLSEIDNWNNATSSSFYERGYGCSNACIAGNDGVPHEKCDDAMWDFCETSSGGDNLSIARIDNELDCFSFLNATDNRIINDDDSDNNSNSSIVCIDMTSKSNSINERMMSLCFASDR